ncbi:MAG TPA: hypothetical protein DEA47_05705 [Peptococcaceae bacterium]|nr:MAG: coiled-coil 37..58 [Clostridia bacterium 41_269]HBT20836.1 hypothetical protein [Peptococcaceae bacterium]
MSDNGDFLAGLVIGGLLGFIAGVLLAPASGKETRSKIADKTFEIVEQTKETIGEVSGKVKSGVTRVVETAREKLPCCSGEETNEAGQETT